MAVWVAVWADTRADGVLIATPAEHGAINACQRVADEVIGFARMAASLRSSLR